MTTNVEARFLAILLACMLSAACAPEAPLANPAAQTLRPIPLPIAYADARNPGVMLFMNEAEGMVVAGNRDPGNWLFAGPPPQPHVLEPCRAGRHRCLEGLSGFHPIVVGTMEAGRREEYQELGIAVVRLVKPPAGCDTFETTPLRPGPAQWSQTVTVCPTLGIVQMAVSQDGRETHRLDLKSAQGLLGSGSLLSVEKPASVARDRAD